MAMQSSWEKFFNDHAPVYHENDFVSDYVREVDFLLRELGLPERGAVLDVGCGTGRHSIELAERGYAVTGLDLSPEMLALAKREADTRNVRVEWVRGDAADFSFPKRFDGAICICEGAFGLLGAGDDHLAHPLAILACISRSLKPGAKSLFTMLNGMAMLRKDLSKERFDPVKMVESSRLAPREGCPPISLRERYFVPTELELLFRVAGMTVLNIWGGTAGDWGRRPPDPDEMEIMVVAEKTGEPHHVLCGSSHSVDVC